jgi:hypothetical protein
LRILAPGLAARRADTPQDSSSAIGFNGKRQLMFSSGRFTLVGLTMCEGSVPKRK